MSVLQRLNISALKKATTWGTEVNVNVAGAGIRPLNPGAPQAKLKMLEDEVMGAFEGYLTAGPYEPVDFTLDFHYHYDGLENLLLALLFGQDTTQQQGATTAYLHALSPVSDISGLFATYATQRGSKIHVVPSVKPQKASWSIDNGLLKLSIGCRGSHLIDNSAVITSLAAVTETGNLKERAAFYKGKVRINAQSGAALSDSDSVQVKNLTIEFERKLDSELPVGGTYILEPLETDKPVVKVTLEFPRISSITEAYLQDWVVGNEKKMDITFQGSLIASTYYYQKVFSFPRLVIEDVEYADSKVIPAKVVLRGLVADTAPAGMTGKTKPIYVDITNTASASYLT